MCNLFNRSLIVGLTGSSQLLAIIQNALCTFSFTCLKYLHRMNPGSIITDPKGSQLLKISERWYPFIFPSATFSHSSSTRYQYCIRYLFCILSDLLGFIGPLTICSSPATMTATNSSFVGAQPGSTCSHLLPQAPWMPLGCEILGTHSAPTHLPTG